MNNENTSYEVGNLLIQIASSKGAKFVNQLHARSFSLNIFQMNAVALIEATLHVRDPDHGLTLLSEENQEAGKQAHRELSRHLHNFTAAAMTLVDHTRVFMKSHYEGTSVYAEYEAQVSRAFSSDPTSQFVQGLRNYMVHRGLPNSHMFFEMKSSPTEEAAAVTGIRIETASLLEWDGWKAPARKYILAAGKTLNIHEFAEEYLARVDRFHAGLENALRQYHAGDLAEVAHLQSLHQAAVAAEKVEVAQEPPAPRSEHAHAAGNSESSQEEVLLNAVRHAVGESGNSILGKIREIRFKASKEDFPSQRYVTVTLTDADIIGIPIGWMPDENGIQTISYIDHNGKIFGLSESDYELIEPLIDALIKIDWIGNNLSRKFIEDEFLSWSREKFSDPKAADLPEHLLKCANEKVKDLEMWFPVAHLEIEDPITFGPIKIFPITDMVMGDMERKTIASYPEQKEPIIDAFQQLRKDFQGSASVVIPMKSEPALAEELGLLIARDTVDLLRFFSPGAPLLSALCPTALDGADLIPATKFLVTANGTLSSTASKSSADNVARWRMRTKDWPRLDSEWGLSRAGGLIIVEGLSDFQKSLRSSLIAYSKGTTFTDPFERLGHAILALEGLLLKHAMEPIEFNVAERMSFMLARGTSERAFVTQNVRQAYRLRTRDRTGALTPREFECLVAFVYNAHTVIVNALKNVDRFTSRAEFVAAVDRYGSEPLES